MRKKALVWALIWIAFTAFIWIGVSLIFSFANPQVETITVTNTPRGQFTTAIISTPMECPLNDTKLCNMEIIKTPTPLPTWGPAIKHPWSYVNPCNPLYHTPEAYCETVPPYTASKNIP